jgi:hypothetical protein
MRRHDWRRRAKDQRLQLRLITGLCGDGRRDDVATLEMLDGVLGDYHHLALLHAAVEQETLLTRLERARVRPIAHTLSTRVDRDQPKAFVGRVERLWRTS